MEIDRGNKFLSTIFLQFFSLSLDFVPISCHFGRSRDSSFHLRSIRSKMLIGCCSLQLYHRLFFFLSSFTFAMPAKEARLKEADNLKAGRKNGNYKGRGKLR